MEHYLSFLKAQTFLLLLYLCIISGQGGQLVERGDTTYGGKWVVNPSGGLISKGHPLGATGKGRKKPINALKSLFTLKHKVIFKGKHHGPGMCGRAGGGVRTPYNGLYEEVLPESGN